MSDKNPTQQWGTTLASGALLPIPRIYTFTSEPGTPYRPSNNSDGSLFERGFCERCVHDRHENCDVLLRALAFGVDDDEYPTEWVIADDGFPVCTQFDPVEVVR